MTTLLGGPGVACSAMRIRRLEADELHGEERARTEAHLTACARCQDVRHELARERAQLAAALPFDELAAGVAERLARPVPSRRWPRAAGLALAAGLVVVAAVPAVLRVAEERTDFRTKGGAELTVYVRDAGGARPLRPGEPVPPRAALRVGMSPNGRRHAAVALLDADGVVILWAGPADRGVLPGAFEWTGSGEGKLLAVLDDAPVDTAALARRLQRGGVADASPGGRAEVVVQPLRRGPP